jgi:hypothetical protein
MFEIKDYIGPFRQGGFTSYEDAARAAQTRADETRQPCSVYELTLRCIVKASKK